MRFLDISIEHISPSQNMGIFYCQHHFICYFCGQTQQYNCRMQQQMKCKTCVYIKENRWIYIMSCRDKYWRVTIIGNRKVANEVDRISWKQHKYNSYFCVLICFGSLFTSYTLYTCFQTTQSRKSGNTKMVNSVNPLSPHDALRHHFTSLKTDLIFLQSRVLERKFPWN